MFSGMQASVEMYISNSLLMVGYHKFLTELLAKLLYSMSSQFEAESEKKIKNIFSLFILGQANKDLWLF